MHKMKTSSGPPETQQGADVPELRVEEALRKSEERWRSVFENSAIGVALTDMNGRFLATNHVYQRIVGYREEELRALHFLDVTHEDYREANWALITELLEGKRRQFQIEKKYRRKDGSLIWVSNNVSLVPGTERVPRFIMALTEDITERKRAEQALQRSESYLAEAQRLAKTGSWAYNPNTERAIYWSEEMRRIFGLDPQISNLPDREEFLRLVHPEDRDRFNERIDKARRGQGDFAQDYRIVLPDSTVKHIHGIGHAVLDEIGNIIEYVGTDVDVTERKRVEEKLRRSEADLLEAQRMSRTGSLRLDVSTGTVTGSPEVFRIFGVKPDEDTSTPEFWLGRNHPEDKKRVQELFDKSISEKTVFDADYRIVLPDGAIKHLHAVGHPVLNESGDLVEFGGITMDITERKQTEEALRRSESYLAEAQRLSHTGSWAWRLAGREFLYFSEEWYRIYGFDPEKGMPAWEEVLQRVHPDDRARWQASIDRAVDEKSDYEVEYRILFPSGTVKYIRTVGHPVLSASGDLVQFVGSATDITERKQTEEALRRSERDLLEAQRISHTGSWRYDVSSGKVINSPEGDRIYGIGPFEDASAPELYFDRVHPEHRNRIRELFQKSQAQKIDYQADYPIVLPGGTIKNIHAIGHPVLSESGDLVEFIGTTMDVTEQWKARTELESAFEEIKRLKDRLHDENLALREQIDQAFMFEEIVGASPALQTVLSGIVKVAPTDSTVLITGETGTGKELIARAIHKHSQRSGQAFISLNCASIPSSLIASELFGHEKGAFTGALQRRQGRFELAHSGTIFLDEVGELPAEAQIALLRVLQERQFERVGGSQLLPTDVRVIAATNRDLTAAIAAGTFRADLFYRLNVFPIEVPPLRRRKEDIPMLVEYFVKRYAEKTGKQIRKIEKNTLELCQSYPWPGNIRELQNIVERSVILCNSDTFWIEKAWLAREQARRPELPSPLPDTLQNQEKEIIEAALAASKGKVAGPGGAAAKLGIPRSTLDSKIKQLKIMKYKFISEA
jgi:PAS domain S-box-containing protein